MIEQFSSPFLTWRNKEISSLKFLLSCSNICFLGFSRLTPFTRSICFNYLNSSTLINITDFAISICFIPFLSSDRARSTDQRGGTARGRRVLIDWLIYTPIWYLSKAGPCGRSYKVYPRVKPLMLFFLNLCPIFGVLTAIFAKVNSEREGMAETRESPLDKLLREGSYTRRCVALWRARLGVTRRVERHSLTQSSRIYCVRTSLNSLGYCGDPMTFRWHFDIGSFEDPLALLTSRRFVASTSYRLSSSPAGTSSYHAVENAWSKPGKTTVKAEERAMKRRNTRLIIKTIRANVNNLQARSESRRR